jgi:hypothetical protein
MKIRLLILAVMLFLVALTSSPPSKADGGNACMDQWSECRISCGGKWWDPECPYRCDIERDRCLTNRSASLSFK